MNNLDEIKDTINGILKLLFRLFLLGSILFVVAHLLFLGPHSSEVRYGLLALFFGLIEILWANLGFLFLAVLLIANLIFLSIISDQLREAKNEILESIGAMKLRLLRMEDANR